MQAIAPLLLFVACAAPSRRLTVRVVDDPIVLPSRLAAAAIEGSAFRHQPAASTTGSVLPAFRVGITDRLELTDLLSLRYAFLDDAPSSSRQRRSPLSLALRAGLTGFGVSSTDGFVMWPLLSLQALRHLGDRWSLSLSAGFRGRFANRDRASDGVPDQYLFPTSSRWSNLSTGLSALRQMTDHIAIGAGAGVEQYQGCLQPLCAWVSRDAWFTVRLVVRPWPWLSLALVPETGFRYRPLILPAALDPSGEAKVPPQTVSWLGGSGDVTFYW
ncbi:MAG TPA: hypothetical protein VGL59_05560 [Polyangia bacterium]